ncbi:MAG: PAS domain S-box protein, partial [Rhodobacterales bacterium]|nr:PAS domain S-box protein [Rhodobacterales bacterium]
MILVASLGVFFVALFASAAAVVPFYYRLQDDAKANLERVARGRVQLVNEHMRRLEGTAVMIASRPRARSLLQDYADGRIGADIHQALASKNLNEAMGGLPEIEGITRLDRDGNVLAFVGEQTPRAAWPDRAQTALVPKIGHAFLDDVEGDLDIVVSAPLVSSLGERLGTDITIFQVEDMILGLNDKSAPLLGPSQEVGLVYDMGGSLTHVSAVTRENGTVEIDVSPVPEEIGRTLSDAIRQSTTGMAAMDGRLFAFAPVRDGPGMVLVEIPESEAYATVWRAVLIAAIAVMVLTALGTLGVFRLVRPLAGDFVLRDRSLMEEIDGKTQALEQELGNRQTTEWALQRSEQRLKGVLDNIVDGIITIDSRGIVQSLNTSALRIFGYAEEDVLGRNIKMLMPNPDRDRHDGYLRNYLGGGEAKIIGRGREVSGLRKDGTEFPMDLAVSAAEVNGEKLFTGIVRDITDFKRAQEDLIRARDAAKAASESKSAFLATMSHEIRTPMNGVVGMIDLLVETELTEDQRDMTNTIRNSAFSLLRIIDDILDFSKIEAGKMHIEEVPVSIRDTVESVVETVATNAERRGVDLLTFVDPTIPDRVMADAGRVRQILFNLAGNAIKFTNNEDGRKGRVIVRADRVDDGSTDTATVRYEV